MGPSVDVPDPLPGEVRVQLGRGDTRMTEQLLDDAQIGTALEQMGRERVAQRVGADPPRQAGTLRRRRDRGPRLLPRRAPPATPGKGRAAPDRRDVMLREETAPWPVEPRVQVIDGHFA